MPATAQVDLRGLATVGYDTELEAPSAGLAAELGWTPVASPVALGLRPSAAVVFAAEEQRFVTLFGDPGPVARERSAVARVGAEAVVRSAQPIGPVAPFLTAGLGADYQQTVAGDVRSARWTSGPVVGAGARVGRNVVQAPLGFGDATRSHLTLGLRF